MFLSKIYNVFFFSKIEKKLYQHYQTKLNPEEKDTVLVQCVEDYFYFGLFGEVIKRLREENSIQVEQFVVRNLTLGATASFSGFLKSVLLNNRFRDKKWIKLYSSYCNSVAYSHENSSKISEDIKYFFQAYKIFSTLIDKKSLLGLNINGLDVGDLIYDSYLRFKPAPTVDIKDFYLCIVIWQCVRNIEITNRYFSKKKPKILLTSYSTYIQHGVAVRLAVKHNIQVYSFGNNQTLTRLLTKDDTYHTANFHFYKRDFDYLANEEKEKCLLQSKVALDNRIKGTIDIGTSYMKKSAYEVSSGIEVPNIKDHIVIFLHDFFDSPHIYGYMIFPDFLEWVEFTIKFLENENIPYCLKPHPNQIGDSAQVIRELKNKYPNTKFISSKITNKQLIDAGMQVGISVYGTVAHELVYMNIPVILCAENPHSSYDFCYEAKDIDEYSNLIKNYKTLKVKNKEEVLSFYYMHNLNKSKDMKELLDSVRQLRNFDFNKLITNRYFSLINNIVNNKEFQYFITNNIGSNI